MGDLTSGSRSAPTIDVREQPHDDVLRHVERAFGTTLDLSTVAHGVYGATEGFRTGRGTWVRVERRERWWINSAGWGGLEAASTLQGVRKPQWHQSVTWTDEARDVVWRADELELVSSPSVEVAGGFAAAIALPDSWWADLRDSLTALVGNATDRVGMSQAHSRSGSPRCSTNLSTRQ